MHSQVIMLLMGILCTVQPQLVDAEFPFELPAAFFCVCRGVFCFWYQNPINSTASITCWRISHEMLINFFLTFRAMAEVVLVMLLSSSSHPQITP